MGPGPGVAIRAVVDSDLVGIAKPDPAIFRMALEHAGGEASTAIHVGDSLRADVLGALGAGIAALHFDPLELCEDEGHPHAASLSEVAARLRRGPSTQRAGAAARGLAREHRPRRRANLGATRREA